MSNEQKFLRGDYLGFNEIYKKEKEPYLGNIGEPLKNFKFESPDMINVFKTQVNKEILAKINDKINDKKTSKDKEYLEKIRTILKAELDKPLSNDINKYDKYIYNVCKNIPFDDNENIITNISEKTGMLNEIPYEIINLMNKENDDKTQYIIGRINTINELNAYNIKAFKTLFLQGKTFDWSMIVNDLFITCLYSYAKNIQNINKSNIENLSLYFPLMLIINKQCVYYPKSANIKTDKHPPIMRRASFKKEEITEYNKVQTEKNTTCIIPINSNDLSAYPSVTFREIMILSDILGMKMYYLETPSHEGVIGDNHLIYYFSLESDIDESGKLTKFGEKIKKYNETNEKNGYKLERVKIEWSIEGKREDQKGGYYDKYMKYKSKYLKLKQNIKLI